MKKKQFFGLGVGLSSVVMIFVVLCLTAFAVLAYFCAQADGKLTDKKTDYAIKYQTADVKAKEYLAELDGILIESSGAKGNINTIEENINKSDYDFVFNNNDNVAYVTYSIDIDSDIELYVNVGINISKNKLDMNDRYTINEWKVVNSGFELDNQNLNVWGAK